MTNDPKKPMDAGPQETPDLLKKPVDLDRRNRAVPSFDQLRTGAPPRPGAATAPIPATARPPSDEAPTVERPVALPRTPAPAVAKAPAAPVRPAAPPADPPTDPYRAPVPGLKALVTDSAQRRPAAPPAPAAARVSQSGVTTLPNGLPAAPQAPARSSPSSPAVGQSPDHSRPATVALRAPAPAPAPSAVAKSDATGVLTWRPAPLPPEPPAAPRVTAAQIQHGASLPVRQPAYGSKPTPAPFIGDETQPTEVHAQRATTTSPARRVAAATTAHADQTAAPVAFPEMQQQLPKELLQTQPAYTAPSTAPKRRVDSGLNAAELFDGTPTDEPNPEGEAPTPSSVLAPQQDTDPTLAAGAQRGAEIYATPASTVRKLGAWFVDATLLVAVTFCFLGVAGLATNTNPGSTFDQTVTVLALPAVVLLSLLALVYTALFSFLWRGRTIGRRLLALHLVDDSGQAPSPMRALARAGFALVSFAIFLSGFWLALFDRRGQTLHDKLTHTFVVRLEPDAS